MHQGDLKVVIVGSEGQLGHHLQEVLQGQCVSLAHKDIAVENLAQVEAQLAKHKPDVVINTAAYHLVDECETNPEKSFLVNTLGARNMAVVCNKLGAKLVHISSDYVFNGENMPEKGYTEFDSTFPSNVYAKSKLEGERIIQSLSQKYFIVRTSWLFGGLSRPESGKNFVLKMINLMRTKESLKVVNDQVGTPTYTYDLANRIKELMHTEKYGLYHIANSGSASWYDFALEIKKQVGLQTPIAPCTSEEFKTKAKRPKFSALRNYMLQLNGFTEMPAWQDALQRYIADLREKQLL